MSTTNWNVDVANSGIHFAIRHMVVSKVRGRFAKYAGTIRLDEAEMTRSVIEVSIDVASIGARPTDSTVPLRRPLDFSRRTARPVDAPRSRHVSLESMLQPVTRTAHSGNSTRLSLSSSGPTNEPGPRSCMDCVVNSLESRTRRRPSAPSTGRSRSLESRGRSPSSYEPPEPREVRSRSQEEPCCPRTASPQLRVVHGGLRNWRPSRGESPARSSAMIAADDTGSQYTRSPERSSCPARI